MAREFLDGPLVTTAPVRPRQPVQPRKIAVENVVICPSGRAAFGSGAHRHLGCLRGDEPAAGLAADEYEWLVQNRPDIVAAADAFAQRVEDN